MKPTRADIAARVEELKQAGLSRAERKQRILEALRGPTPTPRQSGVVLPESEQAPSVLNPPAPQPTPTPRIKTERTTPAAAAQAFATGLPPAPTGPSIGPASPTGGTSMRAPTAGETARGMVSDLGLGLIGFDPDKGQSWSDLADPQAQLVALLNTMHLTAQFAMGEGVAGIAQGALRELPAFAQFATASPMLSKLLGAFVKSGTLGAAVAGQEAPGNVGAGATPLQAGRQFLETTASLTAMDLALGSLGAAGAALRRPVAEQLWRALSYLEHGEAASGGLGAAAKARFLVRAALRTVSAGTPPEMTKMFQEALDTAWKTLGAQEEIVGRMEMVRVAQDEAQRHFNSLFERELPRALDKVKPELVPLAKQETALARIEPPARAGRPSATSRKALAAAQEATLAPLVKAELIEPVDVGRMNAVGGPRAMEVAGITPEDLQISAAATRRTDAFARARETMAAVGATPEEAAKLTGGQAEQIASADKTTARSHATQILGQIRGGVARDARAARLDLIRGRAKLRATLPPAPEVERAVVNESAPKPFDLLSGDEALEETAAMFSGAPPPPLRTPVAAPSGPIESFAELRNAAAAEGWRVQAIEGDPRTPGLISEGLGKGGRTPLPVKEQPTIQYLLANADGQEVARVSSLADLRAALRANLTNKHLAIAEPIGELAFAERDDDDEETKKWKLAARVALRAGTILALAPLATPEGSAGRAWGALRRQFDTRIDAFLTGIADDGLRTRLASRWDVAKRAVSGLYYSMRAPEELFRNHPIALPIVRDLSSARRRIDFERNELRDFLTLAGRAGIRPESTTATHVGAILDAVRSDDILKLPTKGSDVRTKWRIAAVASEQTRREITQEMRDRALLAINSLTPHQLDFVKQYARRFAELRDRAKASFSSTFEHNIGRTSPYVVVDTTLRNANGTPIATATPDAGTFVDRFTSEKAARDYIARRAKRIRDKLDPPNTASDTAIISRGEPTDLDTGRPLSAMTDEEVSGLSMLTSRAPHRDELEARFGADQAAYLTRLVHDGTKAGFNVDDIVDTFPQLDPTHIITEITKLHNVNIGAPYELNGVKYFDRRRASEAVFGPLTDTEYRDLMKQAGIAASSGPASVRETITQGIPQRIFVRFYRDRLRNTTYSLDAAKALAAYAPAVLRDIHYSPVLPRVANGLASLNITNEDPGLLRELRSFIDNHLEREKTFEPNAARAMGFLSAVTYGGMLWGRPSVALRNLIGQTFLIAPSEMGFDTWLGAMRAMADPDIRSLLANERIIHHALPIGNVTRSEAWQRAMSAKTGAEAVGAVKDAFGSAANFMADTERIIRTHAFIGGIIEQMKKDGSLGKLSSINMMSPAGVRPLRDAIKFYQTLPDDAAKALWSSGEDMVRRVAYFFEKSSMPRLYRWGSKNPLVANAMMFTNFPTNYSNRLMSNIVDAFARRLPASVRATARGKLVRLVSMTALIGGPMSLPIINMLTNEVSEQDPGVGGSLKRFLAPYQAFWQRIFFNRDMQWTGVGAPMADLFNPRRFETAPLVRTTTDLIGAVGTRPLETLLDFHPMVNAEIVKARQRAFGAASPYMLGGAEPPDDQFLPEAVMKHVPGGGAFEDIVKLAMNLDKLSGGIGPLDMRGRPSTLADDAIARLVGGRSWSQTQDRLDARFLAEEREDRAIRQNSLIRALVDPSLPAKSRDNAFRALRSNPALLTSLTTADITRFIDESQWTTLERRILKLPPEDALRLQSQFAAQLAASPRMPDQEFQRKARAILAASIAASR